MGLQVLAERQVLSHVERIVTDLAVAAPLGPDLVDVEILEQLLSIQSIDLVLEFEGHLGLVEWKA